MPLFSFICSILVFTIFNILVLFWKLHTLCEKKEDLRDFTIGDVSVFLFVSSELKTGLNKDIRNANRYAYSVMMIAMTVQKGYNWR